MDKLIRDSKAAFIIAMALTIWVCAPGAALAGPAYDTYGTVTFDGIKTDVNEYTGGVSSGSLDLQWFNDHESKNFRYADNVKNALLWEINESSDSPTVWSLNVFFEVPTDARRMIWDNDCTWVKAGIDGTTNCQKLMELPNGEAILDAYADGSHHTHNGTNEAKMSYSTQTGSEKFSIGEGEAANNWFGLQKWQDEDENVKDDGSWLTSREYLIENEFCDTTFCDAWDSSFSVELLFLFNTQAGAQNKIESLTDESVNYAMRLHLSDEANGIDSVTVPEPGPGILLILGLAGLGFARRKAQ